MFKAAWLRCEAVIGVRSVARVVSNKLGLDLHLSARHLMPTAPKGQDKLQPEAKAAPWASGCSGAERSPGTFDAGGAPLILDKLPYVSPFLQPASESPSLVCPLRAQDCLKDEACTTKDTWWGQRKCAPFLFR